MNTSVTIDGDGHVIEDAERIVDFLPKGFRSWLPAVKMEKLFPPLDHFHQMPTDKRGAGRGDVGPEEWREFLDDVGIGATVLYPTKALACGRIRDRQWSVAISRAYNDWLSETYCKVDDRFHGMAILPIMDPDAAAEELVRAVKELGFKGAMLPSHGMSNNLGAPMYEPIYDAASSLGACIAVHGGVHEGFGFDDFYVYAGVHALGHPFGQLVSFASLVLGGVLDRHAGARFAFLEGGISWIMLALERLDESYETHVPWSNEGVIQLKDGEDPADYILRRIREHRIYIGCEGDESLLPQVVDLIGTEALFYSSDFPHEVTTESCKEAIAEARENEAISEEARANILAHNARRFYGLS